LCRHTLLHPLPICFFWNILTCPPGCLPRGALFPFFASLLMHLSFGECWSFDWLITILSRKRYFPGFETPVQCLCMLRAPRMQLVMSGSQRASVSHSHRVRYDPPALSLFSVSSSPSPLLDFLISCFFPSILTFLIIALFLPPPPLENLFFCTSIVLCGRQTPIHKYAILVSFSGLGIHLCVFFAGSQNIRPSPCLFCCTVSLLSLPWCRGDIFFTLCFLL